MIGELTDLVRKSSWLTTVRVDLLDVATLGLVIRTPGMTGAQAGFIIGFAQRIVSELHNLLYDFRNYDLDGVKLERLAEYRLLETENIPCLYDAEGSSSTGTSASVMSWQNWPSEGAVQVSNLCARYAPDMPDILHDVSFSCSGGDRVGIVGATGGGKSTLAKALFSFVEVTAGKIEIDDQGEHNSDTPVNNLDIAGIPLSVLRSRMGIIAQDPVLLSGTLRLNLDIEGKYPDEELLQVLREVQLIHANEGISELSSETSSITAVGDGEAAPGKSPSDANSSNVNVFLNLDFEIETGGQK
jgi:ABC-type multidrug transport system fused ATPase/permease subunit